MTIFFCVVAYYLACWYRIVFHELAHFIVAKVVGGQPGALILGGTNLVFPFKKFILYLGPLPFSGAVLWKELGLSTGKKSAIILAGPIADFIMLPLLALAAFLWLPTCLCWTVIAACIFGVCSAIESRFYEGHDLFEYFRLTSSAKSP